MGHQASLHRMRYNFKFDITAVKTIRHLLELSQGKLSIALF